MKKSIAISFLILVLIFLVGCNIDQTFPEGTKYVPDETNEDTKKSIENMKLKIIDANSKIDSYAMEMYMNIDMETNSYGQNMKINMDSNMYGEYDRINKKMFLNATIQSNTAGMEMEIETLSYIVDDYMYMKILSMWTKTKLKDDVWNTQDQIDQNIELLEDAEIERLDDDSIDEKSYYVFKVDPDLRKAVEQVLKQQQQSDMITDDFDFADMIKSMSYTIWVDKDSFIIDRSTTSMRLVMTDENMGVEPSELDPESGSTEVIMDYEIDMKIKDIGMTVEFELPEEAKNAEDITLGAEAPGVTGKAIADASA